MSDILRLPERPFPESGLFREEYRYDEYTLSEYLDDFIYFESTEINDVLFNEKHSLPWGFFSLEGLNYFLPRILYLIQEDLTERSDLSLGLDDFIINMTICSSLIELIESLNIMDLSILEKIIENILFEVDEEVIRYNIGERYLFLDLEFIDSLKKI
ncbi:hypothetical protein [Neisseria zalophi]|uniref:Uncharacterized protein n=1 Tax=Neisseria zalophi TaxID=640030 RepID=A0A5J6PVA9_9NEIS|nr:hypothetical protein [Neisseria zalophi]QEY26174.1 hypothetical protein D0T92_06300 [Neisseria zalophi]